MRQSSLNWHVLTKFLANYTDLPKTENSNARIEYFANHAGGRPSKYPGVILQLILVKSFQCFTCQRPNNNKNKKNIKFNSLYCE